MFMVVDFTLHDKIQGGLEVKIQCQSPKTMIKIFFLSIEMWVSNILICFELGKEQPSVRKGNEAYFFTRNLVYLIYQYLRLYDCGK